MPWLTCSLIYMTASPHPPPTCAQRKFLSSFPTWASVAATTIALRGRQLSSLILTPGLLWNWGVCAHMIISTRQMLCSHLQKRGSGNCHQDHHRGFIVDGLVNLLCHIIHFAKLIWGEETEASLCFWFPLPIFWLSRQPWPCGPIFFWNAKMPCWENLRTICLLTCSWNFAMLLSLALQSCFLESLWIRP